MLIGSGVKFQIVTCWGIEKRIIFQNFSFFANFGENCLVDEPGLYNLYEIESILILFILLIFYGWSYIRGFRNF